MIIQDFIQILATNISGGAANSSLSILLLIFGLLLIIGIIYFVFKMYEQSKPPVESIVLIAVLTAIATVGRLLLVSIPSVNLASFIIIMVGVVIGKEEGFLVGALTALVTSFFGGLGEWTIFQMLAWGLMGASAGYLTSKFDSIPFRLIFGFVWGFLYGWITDISALFFAGSTIEISQYFAIVIAGLTYDLTHGVSNAILLAILYNWFKKIFERVKDKYLPNIISSNT
ncbi:ECF transporter S component [uncultured Methanobrevibacter sp.]|uniref:ECF transporter S component n=1 Tax=uncultured Methanobrevibacter sp. TaxID=253161 RepID=UPI0025F511AB|nr:ECF transporter S component [uncultured Methanobrevibacter sp.]